MNVYVCICIHTYSHIYMYIYVFVCVCVHTYTYIYTIVCVFVHVFACKHNCLFRCMRLCVLCAFILAHTATHHNTLQHTATHCNTPQHFLAHSIAETVSGYVSIHNYLFRGFLMCDAYSDTGWRRCIGCLIFMALVPQRSAVISGFFAGRDLQLQASYAFSPPCTSILTTIVLA